MNNGLKSINMREHTGPAFDQRLVNTLARMLAS
jgi:hypothetical protein